MIRSEDAACGAPTDFPLHEAAEKGDLERVRLILRTYVDARNKDGCTPLYCAVGKNQLEIAETLLEWGADVNSEQEHGYTPLLHACRHASAEMVTMLIRKGACVDVKSDCGATPLSCAAEFNKLRIAELLIEMGAPVNTADRDHFTPLHLAILEGADIELVKLLLAEGADVNAKDTARLTPLVIAIHEDKMEVTELLLQCGADVNDAFEDDCTLLHLAVENRNSSIAETLLVWGADVSAESDRGETPLDVADTDEVKLTIKRHVVKLKSANVHVGDKLLRAVSGDDEMASFQGECDEEVERLTKEIVCSGGPSSFDVLTKNATRLARLYAKNEKFVPDLRQVDLDAKFPIYGRILSVRFNAFAARKESLERGYELFSVLPRLPQDCIMKILDYLSSKDLMNCSEVCYK